MTLPATVLLVRHARAGERGSIPDDRRRPLDDHGRRQARALPAHLDACLVTRDRPALSATAAGDGLVLVASPLVRCVDTLAPLGAALEVPVATDERLAEVAPSTRSNDGWPDAAELGARADAALTVAGARTPSTGTLVLCAHGEVLPALVAVLVGSGRLAPPSVDLSAKAMPKGAAWLLVPTEGTLEALAPPC